MRRHWEYVTGDSYILDVKQGYDAVGISQYLLKYVMKSFYKREELQELGFNRRWSTSRNWPRGQQVQLRGTVYEEWIKREFASGLDSAQKMAYQASQDASDWLLQPEGDKFFVKKNLIKKKKAKVMAIERLENEFAGIQARFVKQNSDVRNNMDGGSRTSPVGDKAK